MKKTMQKLFVILIITAMATVASAAFKDERITLKNGEGRASTTLNPSRTYRFVITGKDFKNLTLDLKTKGGKIQVEIKSPTGKTLSSGTGNRFRIQKVEEGDYQIILKNVGDSLASVGLKLGEIKGD